MTDIEFMKEKNKILKEELGLKFDLIPESQMIELNEKQKKLTVANIDNENGGTSCLYCIVFESCNGCPMYDAGNKCSDEGHTWVQYIDYCSDTDGVEQHFYCESKANKRMSDLIDRYKSSNMKTLLFKSGNWSITYEKNKLYINAKHKGYSHLYVYPKKVKNGDVNYFGMQSHMTGYPNSLNEFMKSKIGDVDFWNNY